MPKHYTFPDEDLDDEFDEDDELDLASGGEVKPGEENNEEDGGEKIEVEVVDDTPPEDRHRKPLDREVTDPTDEELESHSAKVQKRFKELTRARHDERRRAEALEREKAELERVARVSYQKMVEQQKYISMGQSAYIEKSKALATLGMESAKAKLKQAYDAGDGDAIASAQQEMTNAQLQMQEANNFRASPLPDESNDAYNRQTAAERAPAQPKVDDRTKDWADNNPWFQREGDEDMTGYAMGVHAKLVGEYGEGYTKSPEYYQKIDRAMRKVFPERFEQARKTPAAKRPNTVVASAQRATTVRKVTLTQSQVAIAKRLGISLEGYAKQLAVLEKDNG